MGHMNTRTDHVVTRIVGVTTGVLNLDPVAPWSPGVYPGIIIDIKTFTRGASSSPLRPAEERAAAFCLAFASRACHRRLFSAYGRASRSERSPALQSRVAELQPEPPATGPCARLRIAGAMLSGQLEPPPPPDEEDAVATEPMLRTASSTSFASSGGGAGVGEKLWRRAQKNPILKMTLSRDDDGEVFDGGALQTYGKGRRRSTVMDANPFDIGATMKIEKVAKMHTSHGKKLAAVFFGGAPVENENPWSLSPLAGKSPELSKKEIEKLRKGCLNLGWCASLLTRKRDSAAVGSDMLRRTTSAELTRAPSDKGSISSTPSGTSSARRRHSRSHHPDKVLDTDCFTELCSGSKAGSYLRPMDLCITQL